MALPFFTFDPNKMNPDLTQKFITAVVAVLGLLLSIYNYYKQRERRKVSLFLHLQELGADSDKYSVVVVNEGNKSVFLKQLYYCFKYVWDDETFVNSVYDIAEGDPCFLKVGEAKHYSFTHSAKLKPPNGLVAVLHNGDIVQAKYDEKLPTKERFVRLVYFLCKQRLTGKSFADYGGTVEVKRRGNEIHIYGGGLWCRFDASGGIEDRKPRRYRQPKGLRLKIYRLWWSSRFHKHKPDVNVAFRVTDDKERERAAIVLEQHLSELFGYHHGPPYLLLGEERYGPYVYWRTGLLATLPNKLTEICLQHGLFSTASARNEKEMNGKGAAA